MLYPKAKNAAWDATYTVNVITRRSVVARTKCFFRKIINVNVPECDTIRVSLDIRDDFRVNVILPDWMRVVESRWDITPGGEVRWKRIDFLTVNSSCWIYRRQVYWNRLFRKRWFLFYRNIITHTKVDKIKSGNLWDRKTGTDITSVSEIIIAEMLSLNLWAEDFNRFFLNLSLT